MKYFQPWLIGALVFLPLTSGIAADCKLQKAATFEARVDHMLLVQAKIQDKDVWAALDTGAPFSLINNKLVDELKLPTRYHSWAAIDVTGHETHISAVAKVSLGDFTSDHFEFVIAGRDSPNQTWSMDALFGDNFLEANGLDFELDLTHGKVNIFLSDHCPNIGAYWAHEYVPIPVKVQRDGHIYLPVTLDGIQAYALLDTGSSLSLVDKHVAEGNLNVPTNGGKDKMDGNLTAGSGATMGFYRHTFGTLDIGGIAFHNVELGVAHLTELTNNSVDPHMTLHDEQAINAPIILGLKQLSKLRMYFSLSEHMLYVTPANAQ